MIYYGTGGLAEEVSLISLSELGLEYSDTKVVFCRTNRNTEGSWIKSENTIYCEIGLCDFFERGLTCLMHEVGHSTGLNHNESINFAYEQLRILCGLEHPDMFVDLMNMLAVKKLIEKHNPSIDVKPVKIVQNKAGCLKIHSPYRDILPYADMSSKCTLTTDYGDVITPEIIMETEGLVDSCLTIWRY